VPTLEQLSDRAELTDLVARLARWLDTGAQSDAADVLTDDVTAITPGGRAEGREAVVAQARAAHAVPTLHQITNVLVDLDGEEAAIGAAVTATFADDGATGGRYELAARRTTAGWRLTAVGMRPVYRRGV
jgi:ketosteroid isomerase-like protein